MVVKKRGLGRGLDALLAGVSNDDSPESASVSVAGEGYQLLNVELIQRGKYQPRRDLDPAALEELSASIRAQGVMQPIIVRPVGHERYEIIAGERRWRASQMAELLTIPAIIRDVPDEAAIAMALIENIQRENLNAIEEAMALSRLQSEFELTQQQVADAVGKSRSTVTNLLRLMSLSDGVKAMLEAGDLDMGHARCLLTLDEQRQLQVATEIVEKDLSVRDAETLARKALSGPSEPAVRTERTPDPELERVAGELSRKFATRVQIAQGAKGRGKITLSYDSPESLQALLDNLR